MVNQQRKAVLHTFVADSYRACEHMRCRLHGPEDLQTRNKAQARQRGSKTPNRVGGRAEEAEANQNL